MIYAEADFLLALIKKDDWLKDKSQKILNENKNKITTSIAAIIEIALVSDRLSLDLENVIGSIFELVSVDGMTQEECMEVAHLIKDENVGVFDAFHAVLSRDKPIASSETIYDKIGKTRIKLEKSSPPAKAYGFR